MVAYVHSSCTFKCFFVFLNDPGHGFGFTVEFLYSGTIGEEILSFIEVSQGFICTNGTQQSGLYRGVSSSRRWPLRGVPLYWCVCVSCYVACSHS